LENVKDKLEKQDEEVVNRPKVFSGENEEMDDS